MVYAKQNIHPPPQEKNCPKRKLKIVKLSMKVEFKFIQTLVFINFKKEKKVVIFNLLHMHSGNS